MSKQTVEAIYDNVAMLSPDEDIGDIHEFIVGWRKHFVFTMVPKFLPAYWDVEKVENER